jgi:hypothetical protein
MASIAFEGCFLAPVSDLSDTTYLAAALGVAGQNSKRGEIRMYAGGRTRLVTRPGTVESVNVTVKNTTQANRAAIEALVGELILYRDGRGRKIYGAIFNVSATELTGSQELCDLSFTVTSVTHSEEV